MGNLGDWSVARSYEEACEALAVRVGLAAKLADNHAILEAACGAGEGIRVWLERFGVRHVTGLDVHPGLAAEARARLSAIAAPTRWRVDAGDATDLSAGVRASLDAVVCVDAAYHFDTRDDFLREASRVLRPGGRLALTDVALDREPRGALEELVVDGIARVCAIPRENLGSEESYVARLRSAGFDDITVERLDDEVLAGFSSFVGEHRRAHGRETFGAGWPKLLVTAWGAGLARRRGWLHYVLASARRSPTVHEPTAAAPRPDEGGPMKTGARIAYGLPSFAIALVGVPMFVYLPRFYSDVVGVSVSVLGAIVLGGRAIDAFTDPIAGWLSDRTATRFGKRYPWIAIAAPLLALVVVALYLPPTGSLTLRTAWCSGFVTLFFLLLTALAVPYRALGPELVRDYDDRNALFGVREGLFVVGSVVAMAAPTAIGALFHLGEGAAAERARYAWFAAIAAPTLVLATALCLAVVREPKRAPADRGRPPLALRAGIRSALRQRPFVILLGAYAIAAFGNNLPGALATYYATYVLGIENVGPYLLAFLGAGLAALPFWNLAARRFGKKRAWLAAIALNTLPFALVFPLGREDRHLFALLVTLSGLGAVATVALAPSMQADVIDYDELVTGERRDGQFVGLWMIAEKLAAALGVGIALPLLGAAGYVPNAAQTSHVLLVLRILYVGVPCACNAVAFAILMAYPIDRAAHEAIALALVRRRAGEEAVDPLAKAHLLRSSGRR